MTEQTANLVIEKYPAYRLQWLLGFDDYKTHLEEKLAPVVTSILKTRTKVEACTAFFAATGLKFTLNTDGIDYSTAEFAGLPEQEQERAIQDVSARLNSDSLFTISVDNKPRGYCSQKELNFLFDEIFSFAEFRLTRLKNFEG